MYCPSCGAQNEPGNRFCISCGSPLEPQKPVAVVTPASPVAAAPSAPQAGGPQAPVVPVAPTPIIVAPPTPKPSSPVALAATVGGVAGIVGGAASAIGWFMPWFGLGQIGQSLGALASLIGLGGDGGLGSLLGGGIGGSGFQLLLLAIQVPSLLNAFSSPYGPRPDMSGLLLIVLSAILILVLIPVLGLLNIRAGASALQLRLATNSIEIGAVKNKLDALSSNSTIGFILMVIIFILLAQIPFATMLLSSGFFITAGGFALAWFAALIAKGQVKPLNPVDVKASVRD
ncbi:MAG: zinc ribbon domain-containing protein [Anaerolineae bacterium]|nr:zinc ribbon domain-containing protein [Anaerolineae bacterium]